MIAFMLVATIISAVCSGVAVVAMLLPIVISVSQRAGVSVSRQLIPMSFAASFGCNLTLMGAASNVVVNGALEDLGVPTMTFFELGKVGIPVSIAGIVFFLTIGKRFLTPGDTSDREYLAEYTGSNKTVEFNAVKAGLCLVILAVLLVAMAIDSDSFPMYLVAAFAAFVLVLTGCISQSDAYKSIDLSTLFIVAGMSAVSTGMSKSGAGALIADTAVNLLGEHPNKLLVLFKTHLDIGFTDLASNVITKYMDDYIPKAIDVAAAFRKEGGKECFQWTTGSWLIHEYLRTRPADKTKRLCEAIEAGDITWHGLRLRRIPS